MKNIFLTGFMGCGKSSVGRMLSQRIGYSYIDLDDAIVDFAGISIKDIFATKGEPEFRTIESEILCKVSLSSKVVVSTGGGAVIAQDNRIVMRKAGIIINLTASPEVIAKRLSGDNKRPLLAGDSSIDRISTMLNAREVFYADADLRIETTSKTLALVVGDIIKALKEDE